MPEGREPDAESDAVRPGDPEKEGMEEIRLAGNGSTIVIGLNAVIVAVTEDSPRVLTIRDTNPHLYSGKELRALPFGLLDSEKDRTLELGVRRWVREQTGLQLGYVEQLYTFGDKSRNPGGIKDSRFISIAYLALVRETLTIGSGDARWVGYYSFLPWEDRRDTGRRVIDEEIVPELVAWAEKGGEKEVRRERMDRIAIAFGLGEASWDVEKTLERYELIYEAGLAEEFFSDRDSGGNIKLEKDRVLGQRMAMDYRRMLATALGRMRGKIRYRPVVFELLPAEFTLYQLQRIVEALSGVRLHKQNFRRLVDRGGLVERTGRLDENTGGRPAEYFRFRRSVLRERRAPGVGLPGGG